MSATTHQTMQAATVLLAACVSRPPGGGLACKHIITTRPLPPHTLPSLSCLLLGWACQWPGAELLGAQALDLERQYRGRATSSQQAGGLGSSTQQYVCTGRRAVQQMRCLRFCAVARKPSCWKGSCHRHRLPDADAAPTRPVRPPASVCSSPDACALHTAHHHVWFADMASYRASTRSLDAPPLRLDKSFYSQDYNRCGRMAQQHACTHLLAFPHAAHAPRPRPAPQHCRPELSHPRSGRAPAPLAAPVPHCGCGASKRMQARLRAARLRRARCAGPISTRGNPACMRAAATRGGARGGEAAGHPGAHGPAQCEASRWGGLPRPNCTPHAGSAAAPPPAPTPPRQPPLPPARAPPQRLRRRRGRRRCCARRPRTWPRPHAPRATRPRWPRRTASSRQPRTRARRWTTAR